MTEKNNTGMIKKNRIIDFLPITLSAAALVVSAVGLFRVANISRQIIYAGQVVIGLILLIQGVFHLKDGGLKYLKTVLYACAFLEALRATILITIGVNTVVGYVARFILIMLACSCVSTAERMGRKGVEIAAASIIALEILLYLVFLFGFPGIMLGLLNRFLPLAGVLIAGSIFFLIRTDSDAGAEL